MNVSRRLLVFALIACVIAVLRLFFASDSSQQSSEKLSDILSGSQAEQAPAVSFNTWLSAVIRVDTAMVARKRGSKESYTFKASLLELSGMPIDQLQQDLVLHTTADSTTLSPLQNRSLRPGCEYKVVVRLRAPKSLKNPGLFDYEKYLKQEGVAALAKIRAVVDQGECAENFRYKIEQYRTHVAGFIDDYTFFENAHDNNQAQGVLKALAIGERASIHPHDRALIQRNGLAHLLAISGLHIGLVAVLVSRLAFLPVLLVIGLFGRVLRFIFPLIVWNNSPALSAMHKATVSCLALCCAGFYALLAGLPPSSLRALSFLAIYYLFRLLNLPVSLWGVLLATFGLLVLVDPELLYEAGFWLSFLAVSCIAFLNQSYDRVRTSYQGPLSRYSKIVSAFLVFQLMMALTLVISSSIFKVPANITSPLSNALLVPLVSLLTVPSLLVSIIIETVMHTSLGGFAMLILGPIRDGLLSLSGHSVHLLYEVMSYLDRGPTIDVDIGRQPVALIVLFLSGLCAFIPQVRAKGAAGAAFCLVVVIALCQLASTFNDTDRGNGVTVLDVGQGLAVHVQYQGLQLLFDTGFSYSAYSFEKKAVDSRPEQVDRQTAFSVNSGRDIIVPYLQSKRVKLDAILISHWDADHAGGLSALLSRYPSATLIADEDTRIDFAESELGSVERYPCSQAQRILKMHRDKQIPFELKLLWPTAEDRIDNYSRNDMSCVYQLNAGKNTVLLMGDVGAKVESYLLKHNRLPAKVDLLIAGHHGSKYSSSEAFVRSIKASTVVFSASRYNHYGHPSPQIVRRFEDHKARVHNTGTQGAFYFPLDP